MKSLSKTYLLAIVVATLIGFFVAREFFPRIVVEPTVEYVDREIRIRDTVTVDLPSTRRIYVRDTVFVDRVIRIPPSFAAVGVISARPIRFNRGSVTLTYFAPDREAFVQDSFRIRPPAFDYYAGPTVVYGLFKKHPGIGFEAGFRVSRLVGFGRASVLADGIPTFTVGVRYNVIGGFGSSY